MSIFLENQITAELSSHLIHWLKALARGKVIIVVNNIENEFAKSAFTSVCKCIMGDVLPNLRINRFSKHGVDVIKELNSKLETKWPCLNTFVQFPLEKAVL